MFESLAAFPRIFVTGAQRSGTTICARIITEETGHQYIDEEDFGIHLPDGLKEYLGEDEQVVIQCPGVSRWIHDIARPYDIVIWMRRPTDEILCSQRRIGWNDANERVKYKDVIDNRDRPICEIKNQYWIEQRQLITNYLEVSYESLQNHSMFVQSREEFTTRQWKPINQ